MLESDPNMVPRTGSCEACSDAPPFRGSHPSGTGQSSESIIVQVSRIIRTNVFPVFLLTLGVLVWCSLEFLNGIFPLFVILGKCFRWTLGACTGTKRSRAVIAPGKKMRSRYALLLAIEVSDRLQIPFFCLRCSTIVQQ